MNKSNDEYEIDLMRLMKALLKNAWVIILAAVLAGGAAFGYARFLIAPSYESEALLYVNNSSFSVGSTSFSISSSELSAAQSLVDTYLVILNTRSTLNEVIREAELDYSYEDLKKMISSHPVNSTEVFSITVTSHDPKEAENIANTIAEVLPDKIADIVDGSSVRIVDYAVIPSKKASPSITKYTAMGIMLGGIIACAAVVIRELMDTQIHSEEYLLQTYDLPLLAVIPDLADKNSSGYYTSYQYGGERKGQ